MEKLEKKNYLIIHHTAGNSYETIEDIKRGHLEKGYADIGYHKIIYQDGRLFQGRSDDLVGAQALDLNRESLGICLIGNFEETKPTEKQIKTLIQVVSILCKRYSIPVENVIGHRDVAVIKKDPSVSTLCPGQNLYNLLPEIRKKVKKYL